MSGYFEGLASRGAGLAPAGQPFVLPRPIARFDPVWAAGSPDAAAADFAPTDTHAPAVRAPDPGGQSTRLGPPDDFEGIERESFRDNEPQHQASPAKPQPPPFRAERVVQSAGPGPRVSPSLPGRDANPAFESLSTLAQPPVPKVERAATLFRPLEQRSMIDPASLAPVSQDALVTPRSPASEPLPRASGVRDVSSITMRPTGPSDRDPASEDDAPEPVTLTIGRIDVTVEGPTVSSPPGPAGPPRSRGFQAYARARRGELR